ncbi:MULTISPECIES: alpha/beta fold hydrolase [Streptomyces]|uniref:Alpha/beta hydrolase n=1 Tax=Streptomyces doudnae TaxID=3075536 RepID=A0ABD5EZ04_9ACTN|nr:MULTISPECIES: alpha/beta hydrolase [unclassified Streptomyces]MDT0439244.1 alpha/beta hydrolase [Streptomyces sp. DSM 41981]MYQ65852.1 alpha/beta fold hydrolase [Streptomyces sp. SID4950]SCE08999.1 Pimeloyl-ACP methyl ester carboxylesterase [Streptomyces sp. SolWspMP-5a-2]
MPELRRVTVNGVELNVALAGSGPAVLLLHGFPHTWEVWTDVMADLCDRHRVIAPDLRGFGASGRADSGYDAGTLAEDAASLLAALGVSSASVVGIDVGTAPAFLLALRRPDLVRRLVVMEAVLGGLPGAEDFLADGPPWWFGFHSAQPGLAETVLEGHEAEYIDWFLNSGTLGDGVRPALRDAFVRAYTGRQALGRAFSSYRALPESAAQLTRAVATARLTVPTMALGAHPIGGTLERQLRPVADDLTGHVIEDCGHIIPLHRPQALLALLRPFLAGEDAEEGRAEQG